MSHAQEFAGRLKERVVIEAPVEERTPTGVRVGEWREVARCLAAISARGAGAEAEGMALSAMGRFVATIRWREGVAMGQRLRWRGRLYLIRRLMDDPRLPDRIELEIEEWRA